MLKAIGLVFSVCAVLVSPAFGQSAFNGSWKINLSSIDSAPRPEVIAIQHGVFVCQSCDRPFHVAADSAFHKVRGQEGFDDASVRVIDAGSYVRTNRLHKRIVRVETRTVGSNPQYATMTFTDTINPGIAPVTGKQTLKRLADGPPGSHALSGTWLHQTATEVSDNALTQTFLVEGDTLTMKTGEGFSYTAKMDGTPTRANGDPLVDSISVKAVGEREIQEADSGKGTIIARYTYRLSEDGSVLTITMQEEKTGKVSTMRATKM